MSAQPPSDRIRASQWGALALLGLVYTLHTIDRNIISAVVEPIKQEFQLSDRAVGALSGMAHSVAYAIAVLPLGWLVDRVNRTRLLAGLLALWSGMTAFSGLAGSYACMSLIADIFPGRRRASAIGIFYLSTAIGTGIVFLVGSRVAHDFGWRSLFFVAGIPGLIVALVLWFVLKEPQRGTYDSRPATAVLRLADVKSHVTRTHTVLYLCAGITLAAMLMSSLWTWTASFLIRLHGLDIKQAGLIVAIAAGACQALGAALAGPVADRVAHGRPGRLALVPSVMMTLATLAGWGLVFADSIQVVVVCAGLMGFMLGGWLGPGYGLMLTVTPTQMRGRVTAASQLITNLLGVGLGPLVTGSLSDAIGGSSSLRPALAMTLLLGLGSAAMFLLAAKSSQADLLRLRGSSAGDQLIGASA
jgi:MFS family permease